MKQKIELNSFEAVHKEAAGNISLLFNFRKTIGAYIVLIVLIIASFVMRNQVEHNIDSENKLIFEKATSSLMSRFEKSYERKYRIIESLKNLFHSSFVVKDVFELNGTISVNENNEIKSIDYIHNVHKSIFGEFTFEMRSQGYYDLRIHPFRQLDNYYLVNYVVPYVGNESRVGFEFSSDSVAFAAIEKSRDNNTISSTKIYQIQEGLTGFHLVAPAYRKGADISTVEKRRESYEGSIIMEIDSKKFFVNAVGQGTGTDSLIIFKVADVVDGKERTAYASDNFSVLNSGYTPVSSSVKEFPLADRNLKVYFYAIPDFGGEFNDLLPTLTLILSLVISFSMFAFLIALLTSRARAMELADRMTVSQRRIMETSNDIIGILDFSGKWKSINHAIEEILGYTPSEVFGEKIDKLFYDDRDRLEIFSQLNEDNSAEEFTISSEIRMVTKDYHTRWISWRLTVSKGDGLIYAIGRDTTLKKLEEEREKIIRKQSILAEQIALLNNESKSMFITDLSEKLKLNLFKISENLGELHNEIQHDRSGNLTEAEQAANYIYSHLEDILEVSHEEEYIGKLMPQKINLYEMMREVFADLQESAGELEVQGLDNFIKTIDILGDKEQLVDVTVNLLKVLLVPGDNQVTFNAAGNNIEKIAEIQFLLPPNKWVEREITLISQEALQTILPTIEHDEKDVLYSLVMASVFYQRMGGRFSAHSLEEDGLLITMNLKLAAS